MSSLLLLIVYLLLNIVSFCSYGWDKHKAKGEKWRTKESTLLLLGLLGPWGAVCGMYHFHHKTLKPVFKLNFVFLVIHIILLFVYFHGFL